VAAGITGSSVLLAEISPSGAREVVGVGGSGVEIASAVISSGRMVFERNAARVRVGISLC
jgi:hypothetical protein